MWYGFISNKVPQRQYVGWESGDTNVQILKWISDQRASAGIRIGNSSGLFSVLHTKDSNDPLVAVVKRGSHPVVDHRPEEINALQCRGAFAD